MSNTHEVQSVNDFDLTRYLGMWFEIGRLPLKWEAADATRITAHYSQEDDGGIRVDNRCFTAEGAPEQTIGRAVPVDGETGQLKVSFLPRPLQWIPFTDGDYWVLKIDEAYSVALVGTPDRQNLWLLARAHEIDLLTEGAYLDAARAQGFDLGDWIRPEQDGGRVHDADLAAAR